MSHTWKPGVCALFLFLSAIESPFEGLLHPQPQPLRSGAPLKESVLVHRAGENGGFGTSVMSRRPDATRTLLASRQEESLARCSGRLTALQPSAGHMERRPHKPLSAPGFHPHVQPSPCQGSGGGTSTWEGRHGDSEPPVLPAAPGTHCTDGAQVNCPMSLS